MPTVHREDGFRVVIYPNDHLNDHLPCHVHIRKGEEEVIICLGDKTEVPSIRQIYDMSNKNTVRALELVQMNQAKLIAAWESIHG
ncbi:MAG: DUF4160 domain-containing protein [Leptolyngbyaceae cyanobacterium bins.302]|nr:DUF4160 domain-containing protein [Leptolyngbyaceae cyanobacterium bins.302]